jgi:hypothetical protein
VPAILEIHGPTCGYAHLRFPVIVDENEDAACQGLNAPSIPDEEVRDTLYLLTYSENHSCGSICKRYLFAVSWTFPLLGNPLQNAAVAGIRSSPRFHYG